MFIDGLTKEEWMQKCEIAGECFKHAEVLVADKSMRLTEALDSVLQQGKVIEEKDKEIERLRRESAFWQRQREVARLNQEDAARWSAAQRESFRVVSPVPWKLEIGGASVSGTTGEPSAVTLEGFSSAWRVTSEPTDKEGD